MVARVLGAAIFAVHVAAVDKSEIVPRHCAAAEIVQSGKQVPIRRMQRRLMERGSVCFVVGWIRRMFTVYTYYVWYAMRGGHLPLQEWNCLVRSRGEL